jgi:hypothetical protein
LRVFHNEGAAGSETSGGKKIGLGMRFAIFDIVTGDDGGKAAMNAGAFQNGFDFGAAGGRDDGELVTGKVSEERPSGLRNRRIGVCPLPEEGFLFGVILPEIFDIIGRIFLAGEGFEHLAIGNANAIGAICLPSEGDTEWRQNGCPTIEMDGFTVG